MIINQKFLDDTVRNYLISIQDEIQNYPQPRQLEIITVMAHVRKIKLDNLSEADWKALMLATKAFADSPFKNDFIAIFKYANEKFLNS